MLIINIDSNKISPFVESKKDVIFVNPTDVVEVAQTTSRITQIDLKSEDNYNYKFSIKLSPVINDIQRPSSVFFTNFRELENFNKYIDNFKDFDEEEKKTFERFFINLTDVITSFNNEYLINNNDEWDFNAKENFQTIKNIFMEKNLNKKSSIRNLYEKYNRTYYFKGLNEDIKIKFPLEELRLFNDILVDYSSPTIYNNKQGFWENYSVIKILNNHWEDVFENIKYQEKKCFINKINYPMVSNSNLNNFYFGGFLEPFPIRSVIENKTNEKNSLQGLKSEIVNAGKNSKDITNIINDYTDLTITNTDVNKSNFYYENNDSIFSKISPTTNLNFKKYITKNIFKNPITNSPFDSNGRIIRKAKTVIQELDTQTPIYIPSPIVNYLTDFKNFNPISHFNDNNNKNINQNRTGNFYDNLPEQIQQQVFEGINNTLFYKKEKLLLEEKIQYSSGGYDINKSTNPVGRDSIIYIGFKE